jgi:hypothetical protein
LRGGCVFGETIMGWTIGIVALSLIMTVLTIAELRQPVKTTLSLPALTLGDRVIGAFVVVTFSVAFINGLILLAANILP